MEIKIDLDDNLSLQKSLNMHDVVIFIKSVFNENYIHYY